MKEGAAHNWYSDRKQTTIIEFNKPLRSEDHPTMKPVDLFTYLMKNSSKQGDIVMIHSLVLAPL
jgi:site-specific DNA-methyltransferase (adenine-specific)